MNQFGLEWNETVEESKEKNSRPSVKPNYSAISKISDKDKQIVQANLTNECILVVINLIVSDEHSVHFNTNVCSRFCCTPRPFQACGYPLLLLYLGGFGFILVFSTGVCAIAAVYFKAISPMTQFHRFLFSLHMHDNPTALFGFLPVPCVHC